MEETYLIQSSQQNANISGASLLDADFRGANLENADFNGVEIEPEDYKSLLSAKNIPDQLKKIITP